MMKNRLAPWLGLTGLLFAIACGSAWAATGDPVLRIEAVSHTGPIRRLAVDPSETWMVTVGDDDTARVWDLKTQRMLSVLRIPIGDGEPGKLYGAAISPDGKTVAVGGTTAGGSAWGHRIYLFELQSGALSGVIDARAGHVRHLDWSGDGRHLIASYAGEDGMRVFDRATGRPVFEERFSGPSYGATVSASGQIAVPAFDGQVHLYALVDGRVQAAGTIPLPLGDPISADFSPDGRLLAVGYLSRRSGGQVQVDVFDLASKGLAKSFQFTDLEQGNLKNVLWSRDGKALYAAGSGYHGDADYIAKKIDWLSGKVTELKLGRDTITDMTALAGDRVAFSTFEPAWGLLQGDRLVTRQGSPLYDLRGASQLKIDPQAMVVSWRSTETSAPVTFDLKRRAWLERPPGNLRAARHSSFRFATERWENSFVPRINGRAVPLGPGEVSRAAAVLPDDSAVLLATSWNLRKIDRSGNEVWRLPAATEIRAVQVSDDSEVIVIASSDGTLRWLSAADGRTLMSLFAVRDGRWILWTDPGHYDTSVGGESLIGWHVNRPDNATVDFFPVSRFRDRFYRPDVIDRVLPLRSAGKALAEANDDLRRQAAKSNDAELDRNVQLMLEAAPVPARPLGLPPVLTTPGTRVLSSGAATVSVEFSVFSHQPGPISSWELKVDGRPVVPLSLTAPAAADGKALGRVTLVRPEKDALVQLFARNAAGVSEPLTVQSVAPAIPASALPPEPAAAAPRDKRPTLYVLAVGVSTYANSQYNLGFPSKDATDFANVLKLQEGRFYKQVVVRLLTDKQATRQAITSGLGWLRQSTSERDMGVLFIAGHGITDAGNTYRFLPHDADTAAPQRSMVAEDQIREALVNIRGKALFFVDTCYSGNAIGHFTKHDITLIANKLASPESGVVVFSSSDGRQESLEKNEWNNGAFTKALVSGLRGKADFRREGVVTHKGLDYFVSHEVRKLTEERQTPVTTVPIGITDFTLTQTLE